MTYLEKIKDRNELKSIVDEAKASGKVVVQCHGCFDILHPGHFRHLASARDQGDLLVVTVSADTVTQKGANRPYVPQKLRAENLAAVEVVDYVAVDDGEWAGPILELLQPNIYIKGKEFEDVHDGRFGRERRLVEAYGGRVRFSSGDVVYSSTQLIEGHREQLEPVTEQVQAFCERHEITQTGLQEILEEAATKKVLVIGETIVDRYIYTDPLGMSADTPVLVVRPRETETFVGGAAIVAQHVQALGAESRLVSVVGDDEQAGYVRDTLTERGVHSRIVTDPSRPTIVKTRYLSEGKKLLNVNEFREHNLEREANADLLEKISELSDGVDAVIISDFSYGLVTPSVLEWVAEFKQRTGVPVVGDVQCSTQLGNVTRLENITAATPSEREARLSLCDRESGVADLAVRLLKQTRNQAMIVTLGSRGMIVLENKGRDWEEIDSLPLHEVKKLLSIEYLPSFTRFAVDSMGAGDALLGALAVSLAAGGSISEAVYLGNCASAVEVGCMGNIPVRREDVLEVLSKQAEEWSTAT